MAGIGFDPLSQTHGSVGLVIPEFLVLADGYERVGVEIEGGADCPAETLLKLVYNGGHRTQPGWGGRMLLEACGDLYLATADWAGRTLTRQKRFHSYPFPKIIGPF